MYLLVFKLKIKQVYKYRSLLNNKFYGVKITPMSKFHINHLPNHFFLESIFLNKLNANDNFIQKVICSFHDYDNPYFISKFYRGFFLNHLDKVFG